MNNIDFLSDTDLESVRQYQVNWDKVLVDSILVDIHITMWNPVVTISAELFGAMGADFQSDESKKALAECVRAGKIDLIPRSEYLPIQRSAAKMRDLLKAYSFDLFGSNLISAQAYPAWRAAHDKELEKFDRLYVTLCDNLQMHISAQGAQLQALFADAYGRLSARPIYADGIARDEFISRCVASIMGNVPSVDQIRRKYTVNLNFQYAPVSTELEAQQESLSASRENTAMFGEVRAQAQSKKAEMLAALESVETGFYEAVENTAREIQNGLKERGRLIGRSAVQLRALVDKIKTLNVFDDRVLAEQAARLESAVDARINKSASATSKEDALGDLSRALDGIQAQTKRSLSNLTQMRGVRAMDDTERESAPLARTERAVVDIERDAPLVGRKRRSMS